MLSSSDGAARFWDMPCEVKSSPLSRRGILVWVCLNGVRDGRTEGGRRGIPNKPEKAFCGGVLFSFEFISD